MKNTEILSENYLNILRENYTEDEIESMTRKDILNAILSWWGIYGYTYKIVDVMCELFPSTGDLFETNLNNLTERDFDFKLDEREDI